jgi:hypothetical protein
MTARRLRQGEATAAVLPHRSQSHDTRGLRYKAATTETKLKFGFIITVTIGHFDCVSVQLCCVTQRFSELQRVIFCELLHDFVRFLSLKA